VLLKHCFSKQKTAIISDEPNGLYSGQPRARNCSLTYVLRPLNTIWPNGLYVEEDACVGLHLEAYKRQSTSQQTYIN